MHLHWPQMTLELANNNNNNYYNILYFPSITILFKIDKFNISIMFKNAKV